MEDIRQEYGSVIDKAIKDYKSDLLTYDFKDWSPDNVAEKLYTLKEWYKAEIILYINKKFPLTPGQENTVSYRHNANDRFLSYGLILGRNEEFEEIYLQSVNNAKRSGLIR